MLKKGFLKKKFSYDKMLRLQTQNILENYSKISPRSVIQYFADFNNDQECKDCFNNLPTEFQDLLNLELDNWENEIKTQREEIQKQRDDIQKRRDDIQKQRDEIQKQRDECQERTRISEQLNEEVLRRLELMREINIQLGLYPRNS